MNVNFVNFWDKFSDDRLFLQDGVHLNPIGNARLGRLLDNSVKNLFRVNRQNGNSSGNELAEARDTVT